MKKLVVGKARIVLGAFLFFSALLPAKLALAESQSGSVGLSGKVIASAPNESPVISLPLNQTHFSNSEIIVSGICQSNQLIKIFLNKIFSGAVTCSSGKFSIAVDLVQGKNQIIARGFDNLDQAGPDSNIIEVYLDNSSDSLTLTSTYARKRVDPKSILSWPIVINGGVKPYAIYIDWGDGRTSLKSVVLVGEFSIDHNYQNPGVYKVVLRAVDQNYGRAILQLVAVVNGKVVVDSSEGDKNKDTIFLWQPMAAMIVFMILTFWLGERYERRRLEDKY